MDQPPEETARRTRPTAAGLACHSILNARTEALLQVIGPGGQPESRHRTGIRTP